MNRTKYARNAEVVRLRQEGQTLAAIGQQMGVTGERIRQILVWQRRRERRLSMEGQPS